eukprot:15484044-Alexandrium_andersonii.AAC.1
MKWIAVGVLWGQAPRRAPIARNLWQHRNAPRSAQEARRERRRRGNRRLPARLAAVSRNLMGRGLL